MTEVLDWIKTIGGMGLGAVAVAYITTRGNQRTEQAKSVATPYADMRERLERVEHRLDELVMWAAVVVPIHADLTARWSWWREQDQPPAFPPFPISKES